LDQSRADLRQNAHRSEWPEQRRWRFEETGAHAHRVRAHGRKETDGGEAGTSTVRSSGITDMMQPDFERARTLPSLLTVRLATDAGSTGETSARRQVCRGRDIMFSAEQGVCKVPLGTPLAVTVQVHSLFVEEAWLVLGKTKISFPHSTIKRRRQTAACAT